MPAGEEAVAMRVQKGEDGGEIGVIVDYVGQVGHCFAAFVGRCCENRKIIFAWINSVYGGLPASEIVSARGSFS